MLDVFISYPHKAAKAASQLARALRAKGVRTWYAEENLTNGQNRKIEIHSAIKDARAVAVLILPDTPPSAWMLEEYMAALESYWSGGKKLLVPVILGDAEPPGFLQQWKSLKIQKTSDWKRVANQIAKWLSAPNGPAVAWPKKAKQEWKRRLDRIEQLMRRAKVDPSILEVAADRGLLLEKAGHRFPAAAESLSLHNEKGRVSR